MNEKEIIEIAEKHLTKEDENRTEDPKIWVDSTNSMMFKTDRSEIINILKNYRDVPMEKYDKIVTKAKETITARSGYNIGYVKDILKLLTKLKTDATKIIIETGNDACLIIRLEDASGIVIEVVLAPRVDVEE